MRTAERGYFHADTVCDSLFTKVAPPGPDRYREMHGITLRVDSHAAIADVRQWPDVARVDLVHAYCFKDRFSHRLAGERDVHLKDMGGSEEAINMLLEPEHH